MDYQARLKNLLIPENIAIEHIVSYDQKYDPNHKSPTKLSISDFDIVEMTSSNYKTQAEKYKMKLGFLNNPFRGANAKHIIVHVVNKETHKSVCTAVIWPYAEYKAQMEDEDDIPAKEYSSPGNYLDDLTVRKEVQGQGIGTQLCKIIISKYNIKYVDTFDSGEVARKIYEKLGFKTFHVGGGGIHFMRK